MKKVAKQSAVIGSNQMSVACDLTPMIVPVWEFNFLVINSSPQKVVQSVVQILVLHDTTRILCHR